MARFRIRKSMRTKEKNAKITVLKAFKLLFWH